MHSTYIISFPSIARPSADGYAFIEQLLHSLRTSQNDEDNRTNAELAREFRLSEATLMSLSHTDPQKTSLRLFNALFPGNQEKEALINVAHLSVEYPNLLNNILGKLCFKPFFFVEEKEKNIQYLQDCHLMNYETLFQFLHDVALQVADIRLLC